MGSFAPVRDTGTVDGSRFGAALRGHRLAAGLTQEELADLSGMSVRAIRNLESGRTGRPQRESLRALADGLRLVGAARAGLLAFASRALHSVPAPPEAAPVPRGGPCELPPDPGPLVGRDGVVAALCALLTGPGGARLATVTGPPGAGKTAVVVHVAHLLGERFPDGQIFVDLDGHAAGPMRPDAVAARVLRSLGAYRGGDDAEERAARLRACLAERRAVLVLDNATGEAQIRPLLAGAGRSAVLVAGRRRLPALPEGRSFVLDGLDRDDATALLDALAAPRRVDADRTAQHAIARHCEDLPLALHIAGSWLAARPHRTPRDLADLLDDERHRLSHLQVGDLAVRASIAAAQRGLSDAERHLLRRLSLRRVASFGAAHVAELLDTGVPAAEALLEQLLQAQLIVAHRTADGDLRCRLRPLVALYAAEQDQPPSSGGLPDRIDCA